MILEIGAFRVMVCPSAGDPIGGGNVTDLIGDAIGQQADGVAVPVERLAAEFFRLATGSAGEIAQKAVNYGLHLFVIGDIAAEVAASESFAAFVREANRGRHLWFVTSLQELQDRVTA
jgi:hypothetical protein